MNFLRNFFRSAILLVNIVVIVLMLATAYSPYVHPTEHPYVALLGFAFPILAILNACFLLPYLLFRMCRCVLLPILSLLFCYPQINAFVSINTNSDQMPDSCLKVLSYNTLGMAQMVKGDDGNPILNYIAGSNADIVCLQEYSVGNGRGNISQKDVDKALKAYPYHRIDAFRGNNKVAIYSKLPILSGKKTTFEQSLNGFVTYRLKWNSDTLTLVNCHLESNKLSMEERKLYEDLFNTPDSKKMKTGGRLLIGKLADAVALRAPQAEAVVQTLAESYDKLKMVCGDFNDIPLSYTCHTIEQDMTNAFRTSGNGLGISYNRNGFLFRIDNILVSHAMKAYSCQVDNSINASDHYPISCYVAKAQKLDK